MQRNKFLTEAMGICFWVGHDAKKCGCEEKAKRVAPIDFSEWKGFGKLWEWAQKQEWWDEFVDKDLVSRGHKPWLFPLAWINPNNFANALYKFLNSR